LEFTFKVFTAPTVTATLAFDLLNYLRQPSPGIFIMNSSTKRKIFVWDIHTRVFHWLLVIAVISCLTTGLLDDLDYMDIHIYGGYTVLGLLIFKLITGAIGKDYSRFSALPLNPKRVIHYLKGKETFLGHNPPGSWMIIIMIIALFAQAITGLLTTDDILMEGPWVIWADDEWISIASNIHTNMWRLLILLTATHFIAILYYLLKKRIDLITPMITGQKEQVIDNSNEDARYETPVDHAIKAEKIPLLLLGIIISVAAAITYFLVTFE